MEKKEWISKVEKAVKVLWLEYKGKNFLPDQSTLFTPDFILQPPSIKENIYTFAWAYKRLKRTHKVYDKPPLIDRFEEYLSTNYILINKNQHFNII